MNKLRPIACIAGLIGLAAVLSGCWLLPIPIDESADGTAQTAEIGREILIQLAGTASTGHQWIRKAPASFDGAPLEVISEGDYAADDPNVCGGPGTFTFRYRAIAEGTIELVFEYRRPWETDIVDTFSVIVWVR